MELKLIDDLRQGHVEKFQAEIIEYAEEHPKAFAFVVSNNGATVRAAIKAGWFGKQERDAAEIVTDMTVAEVAKYAKQVNDLYEKVTTLEKN